LSQAAQCFRAAHWISMVTTHSLHKLDWVCDPGWVRRACQNARRTVACWLSWNHRPAPTRSFRDLNLHCDRSAAIPPRLLSCLRLRCVVANEPARLDTGPVANSYPDGISTR